MTDEPPPIPKDLGREQRRILHNSLLALLVCVLVLAAASWALSPAMLRADGGLAGLLRFWAACALLTVLWVLVGFAMVSRGRRHSRDDIRGAAFGAPSARIAVPVAFLQNTVEQALMAVIVQIAVLLLAGAWAAPLVAGQVLLFALGRVTFLLGYPNGAGARAFGLAVTVLPTLAGFILALAALFDTALAGVS